MFIKMKYCKHLKSLDKRKNAEIKLKLKPKRFTWRRVKKRTTIGAVNAGLDGATQNALVNKINLRIKFLNENREICDKYINIYYICIYPMA